MLRNPPLVRELLTANRTYYVRTDGSNSNTGLIDSAIGAFLTKQKAYDTIANTLDLGGFAVTVQIRDGTFTGAVSIAQPWTGGGSVTFQGNSATPANVVISTTSADCFATVGTLPGLLTIKDMKLQTTTAGSGINHQAAGTLQWSGVNFGVCAVFHMLASLSGANMVCTGNYAISGGALAHTVVSKEAVINIQNKTVTLTGTPAFGLAFAYANPGGKQVLDANTYSGSATGVRYNASNGGTIYTNAGGATYLPGSIAGVGTNYGTTPFGLYA